MREGNCASTLSFLIWSRPYGLGEWSFEFRDVCGFCHDRARRSHLGATQNMVAMPSRWGTTCHDAALNQVGHRFCLRQGNWKWSAGAAGLWKYPAAPPRHALRGLGRSLRLVQLSRNDNIEDSNSRGAKSETGCSENAPRLHIPPASRGVKPLGVCVVSVPTPGLVTNLHWI